MVENEGRMKLNAYAQGESAEHAVTTVEKAPSTLGRMSLKYGGQPSIATSNMGSIRSTRAPGRIFANDSKFKEADEAQAAQRKLFVDAAEMKAKLIEQMSEKPYDVREFYHTTGFAQAVARNPYFENGTLAVIIINSLWLSIDTDLNEGNDYTDAHPVFVVADTMFAFYFTVEILFRFGAFQSKMNCLKDAWFMFDSLLVTVGILDSYIIPAAMAWAGNSSSGGGESGILRLFKVLRLVRMARMARLLRACPEMMMLIKGMVSAMRSVVFTLLLLAAMCYVFAVLFRRLTDGTEVGRGYFRNVPVAMNTLLLRATFMDETSELAVAIQDSNAWLLIVLYGYVLLSALSLMNMLIGVLVEVITAIAEVEKETLAIGAVKDNITKVIDTGKHDIDINSDITRDQFMKLLCDHRASKCFSEVDVDVVGLVDCADMIFEGEDYTGDSSTTNEKTLTFGELMGAIIGLRGSKPSTVKHIVDLRKFFKKQTLLVDDKLRKQERDTGEIGGMLEALLPQMDAMTEMMYLNAQFIKSSAGSESGISLLVDECLAKTKAMDLESCQESASATSPLDGKWKTAQSVHTNLAAKLDSALKDTLPTSSLGTSRADSDAESPRSPLLNGPSSPLLNGAQKEILPLGEGEPLKVSCKRVIKSGISELTMSQPMAPGGNRLRSSGRPDDLSVL